MKFLVMVALLLVAFSSFGAGKENTSANAQAVDAACAQEGTTASCGTEKVGTGLIKCIHAYKKEHKDFKISEGCHAALKKMHDEKKK